MNLLVTGGSGFIGRWLVERLLMDEHNVTVVDNLISGSISNIKEFLGNDKFKFINGDARDRDLLKGIFEEEKFDIVYHLASLTSPIYSMESPETIFYNETAGLFNILQRAKIQMVGEDAELDGETWVIKSNENIYPCKIVYVSTASAYKISEEQGIDEQHPTKPLSPFVASKLAAENIVTSFYYTYKLPVTIIRPFNVYGPYQGFNSEGAVVTSFIYNTLKGKDIKIYGNGNQTRDFIYVKDCVDLIAKAGYSNESNGEIINAGTGVDISIKDLAQLISKDRVPIKYVKHNSPLTEIMRSKCNYIKAKELLNWEPKYNIEQGLKETEEWMIKKKLLKDKRDG